MVLQDTHTIYFAKTLFHQSLYVISLRELIQSSCKAATAVTGETNIKQGGLRGAPVDGAETSEKRPRQLMPHLGPCQNRRRFRQMKAQGEKFYRADRCSVRGG